MAQESRTFNFRCCHTLSDNKPYYELRIILAFLQNFTYLAGQG